MVKAVHMNHMGCQKALSRARDIMFWPGMTKQITDYVLACPLCEKYRAANRKEPLCPHEIPDRPWQNVSCDLFELENEQYMVLADAFSHHIEIDYLPNISSKTVIRKLKVHFSRFGCPVQIKTDNGRQFTSAEFEKFASEWNFSHVTSSPNMPSSNGHAESAVKIAKRILRKAKDANTDPYMALMEFRNTPLPCGYSPAQLLMSRRIRSTLPPQMSCWARSRSMSKKRAKACKLCVTNQKCTMTAQPHLCLHWIPVTAFHTKQEMSGNRPRSFHDTITAPIIFEHTMAPSFAETDFIWENRTRVTCVLSLTKHPPVHLYDL